MGSSAWVVTRELQESDGRETGGQETSGDARSLEREVGSLSCLSLRLSLNLLSKRIAKSKSASSNGESSLMANSSLISSGKPF